MIENTLKFGNIRVNKKYFNKSKQPINSDLLNVDVWQVRHNDDGFEYFIGYKESKIVKPLCIILPQITRYIKYFEIREKNVFCNQRWWCAR